VITEERAKANKRSFFRKIQQGLFVCLLSLGLWAFVIEPSRLVVRETKIALRPSAHSLKGLRIAAISDLHVGPPHITLNQLRRIVEMINATDPDLILIAGDFVENALGLWPAEPESIASELKGLKAHFGVFSALGNHDWWYNGNRVRLALEGSGIRVLENDVAKIERNGAAIWVVGFGDLWEGFPNIAKTLAKVSDDAPVIAITHNPDLFPQIPARVALTIAGHTHGGQVALPLIGRPIVPSHFGQRYAIGHIVEGGRSLFVTPGIGTSIIPVRFRVTPEISLLTISD
jgi:hypothetical protein